MAQAVWALGTMSGTSMDGVDAAMLRTDGHEVLEFGAAGYLPYTDAARMVLLRAQGRWPGEPGVDAAAEVVEKAHVELIRRFPDAELVGFHGQTLAHDPAGRGTHQVGDGGRLARALARPVVWDFRSADVQLGGQGAPLAPFFHFALARWIGAAAPLAFLNLGGVGNLTWVDPRAAGPEAKGALLAFDTGPANAPLDDLTRARCGTARDEGGKLAAGGRVDERILEAALARAYFAKMPPKSLDRNDFTDLSAVVSDLGDADALATLAAIAAGAVARGLAHCPTLPSRVLVAGGGRHNRAMMAELDARLPVPVAPVESVGLDGDMIEAQAFAFLAVRVARGMPTSAPGTTGVPAPVGGGTLSRPDRAEPDIACGTAL